MFEQLLEKARAGDLTPELAVRILEDSRSPENALKLFGVASELRDKHIGRELWWTAAIEGIMPCRLDPPCSYCTYSNHEIIEKSRLLKALESVGKAWIQTPSLKRRYKPCRIRQRDHRHGQSHAGRLGHRYRGEPWPLHHARNSEGAEETRSIQHHQFSGDFQRGGIQGRETRRQSGKTERAS